MSLNDVDGQHPADRARYANDFLIPLKSRVAEHEAERLFVYDDATGLPLKKGDTLKGHPTIGIGRNLAGRGITKEESAAFFDRDIAETIAEVHAAFPWSKVMNYARQSVLVEAAFQLGIEGLKKFTGTLSAMKAQRYEMAADGMLNSLWARQTPTRVKRLARIMRSGTWQ